MKLIAKYCWLSVRDRSYIGFGLKAATAAFFSETSILNNSEVYTPFSKFCFLCLAVLKCQTLFDLYVDLLSFIKVKFLGKKIISCVCWAGRTRLQIYNFSILTCSKCLSRDLISFWHISKTNWPTGGHFAKFAQNFGRPKMLSRKR